MILYVLIFNMKDVCFSKYTTAVSKKELSKRRQNSELFEFRNYSFEIRIVVGGFE